MMGKLRKAVQVLSKPGIAGALLRHRVAASVEHESALSGLGCRTVIDIGANRGQFSLMARHLFPEAKIVAFEPLAGPVATFRKVFAHDANVYLHPVAIGVDAGQQVMHISAREDSSSLLPIGDAQSRIFPGTQESGVTVVEIKRLDDLVAAVDIEKPALLKLDVQGFELEALRGSEGLLNQFAWIYCECSFLPLYEGQAMADEVIAWLREHAFKLIGMYNMAYDDRGKAIQADFLFSALKSP